jgi:uncharacterized protein YecE (DUF72 family)
MSDAGHLGQCDLLIGTSGWHYKHWLGPFYPADLPVPEMLSFYQQHFDTVEVNNSFYHLPLESTFENWRRRTAPGFCFAVKASRYLTHMKRLKDAEAGLQRFLSRAELLGSKLGPILFQLPPRWPCDVERLGKFLEALPRRHRYSFEFRDPSWHVPKIYDLLAHHQAAFCIYDSEAFRSPKVLTAEFTYVRFHGPGQYRPAALASWGDQIIKWERELKKIYVYFNNDQAGFAIENALQLRNWVHAQQESGHPGAGSVGAQF